MTACKICGVTRASDARAAAEAGAAAVGVVFAPGRRQVGLAMAKEIFGRVPAGIERVGVFVHPGAALVGTAVATCGLTWVQLSGRETAAEARSIAAAARQAAGDRRVRIVKAVHVTVAADITAYTDYPADMFLLDTGGGDRMGGTGRAFDWELARELPWDRSRVALAGGLTPANVAAAIEIVRPAVVDVSSGVETSPGVKDARRIGEFITAARAAGTRAAS